MGGLKEVSNFGLLKFSLHFFDQLNLKAKLGKCYIYAWQMFRHMKSQTKDSEKNILKFNHFTLVYLHF